MSEYQYYHDHAEQYLKFISEGRQYPGQREE